ADLNQEEKDRKLITALDEARLAQAETLSENRFAFERAVPKFRKALGDYGLPAGEGEPEAAAARNPQRPQTGREGGGAAPGERGARGAPAGTRRPAEPHLDWLRAVAAAVDPDDVWTRRLRAAHTQKDPAKLRATLRRLAASPAARKAPVRSLTDLAAGLWIV